MVLASVMAADGAPKVSATNAEKIEEYSKVYFLPTRNDIAKLGPKIMVRLKKAGFEAEEVDLQKMPFTSQGTGFMLTPEGHVLTCAHVVGSESQATLWVQGTRYLGRVLTLDTNLDAALIKIDGNRADFRFLSFGSVSNYILGQEVFAMGFPLADLLGENPRLNKGLINATSAAEDMPWRLQISAEIQPGNSGGPLLSQKGEVLGMVDSTLNPSRVLLQTGGALPQNVNFAIKIPPLLEFLNSSHLTLPVATNRIAAGDFEAFAKSLALIRGGVVDEKRLHEKPLVCRFGYVVTPGYHLTRARLDFIDVRKLKLVLSVNLDEESLSSIDKVLDAMFAEACDKFSPNDANPFRPAKQKSKSAKKP